MAFTSTSAFARQAVDLDGPTIPPPEGTVSDFDNPPNGNHIAIPIITVCVVVSVISYGIRFYAKYLMKKINSADYLTMVAFPLYWVYIYYSYRLSWTPGYLVHEWDIRLKDISAFSYICFLATLFYLWIIALVKCAILLEWRNIFFPEGIRDWMIWIWYAAGAAITSLSLILFVMDMVNCTPFTGNWNPLVPGRYCRFSVPAFSLASAATNLALELIPLTLAQKVIWGLRLSFKKRMGVSGIFLIGITGCAASTVRLYYATRFYISDDTSYFFSIMALCSLCETTCANLILCVPSSPKAIRGLTQTKTFTGLKQYLYSKNNSPYNTNNSAGYNGPHDVRYAAKPKSDWIRMSSRSRGDDNETTYSKESDRPLTQA